MDGTHAPPAVTLPLPVLDRLMPMHLVLDPDGRIVTAGPTLAKVSGASLTGAQFFDRFQIRRPARITDVAALRAAAGDRLRLTLRSPPGTAFRGYALPLPETGGAILKLSFGIDLAAAVRDHGLTDSDFAPTDLAVEMLYLLEAKGLVQGELNRLTERLQGARDAAERQALTDTLTGLGNRRALEQVLSEQIAVGRPFALMHLDLDRFKQVNDTLGHAAGDHVLVTVARVMAETVRRGDTVARIGGDEFVILLPGLTDAASVRRIAARLIARLEQPIPWGDAVCRISASAGIVISARADPPDPERLLMDADRALYASKNAGRGRATVA